MTEKLVTLLRVPLIQNCVFYKGEDPSVLFTIAESTFKRVLNDLSEQLSDSEYKWVLDELTKYELDELQVEAELTAMHFVFDNVTEEDIVSKQIEYPKELELLYSKYLKHQPYIAGSNDFKWIIQDEGRTLSKEEFMWALYEDKYKLA